MAQERILIVEDEQAVARGLEYGLREEGYRVILAGNGREGLAKALEEAPDLIILDIRLPDVSGFDVCREMRAHGLRQPILILTVRDEEADKVLGLELGADDYLTKPYSLRELISRVRALLRRAYGPLAASYPRWLTIGKIRIDLEGQRVFKGHKEVSLTATEFKLLRHFVTNPGLVFSRQRLLEAVWGYPEFFGDERTVDVHIHHLREKIEDDHSHPRLIVTVRGLGYKFVKPS
jgi:DNA-binding response OmpR family regulator